MGVVEFSAESVRAADQPRIESFAARLMMGSVTPEAGKNFHF